MSIDTLKNMMPSYAKDIKLNLSSLVNDETLNPQQLWGTFLSCAMTTGNPQLIREVSEEAMDNLSAEAFDAAKGAAAIMGMNNIYYRFVHLASNNDYATMPAKLRMNIIGNPGVDKVDFELWSLAVSAINGCGMCIDSHEKTLKEHGATNSQIQMAVKIASVLNAVATVLDTEAATQTDIAQAA